MGTKYLVPQHISNLELGLAELLQFPGGRKKVGDELVARDRMSSPPLPAPLYGQSGRLPATAVSVSSISFVPSQK